MRIEFHIGIVESQMGKGQAGREIKGWNIKKKLKKKFKILWFYRYNGTASLYLCIDKTEGVHHEPAGIGDSTGFFSWRIFFKWKGRRKKVRN